MAHVSIHQFAEKTVFITDTLDRFGRGVAMQMALQGGFIIGGSPEGTQNILINELKELGTLATAVSGHGKSVVDEAYSIFGRLDLLVNVINADLKNGIAIMTASAQKMAERPKGRIVNLVYSSSAVAASEIHAQITLSASEFPANVAVNDVFLICADGQTPLTMPDDVARVVLFLLSSEAKAVDRQMIAIA